MKNLQSELRPYLNADENLVWTGIPKQGILFTSEDIYLIPFSLIWLGFAVFWCLSAIKGSFVFGIFGVPFVVVGIIMSVGRFFIDAKVRAKTIYGVTQDRIIIKSGVLSEKIDSFHISSMFNMEFSENKDGVGTIIFGSNSAENRMVENFSWFPGATLVPQFKKIREVRKVYNLMLTLKKANRELF